MKKLYFNMRIYRSKTLLRCRTEQNILGNEPKHWLKSKIELTDTYFLQIKCMYPLKHIHSGSVVEQLLDLIPLEEYQWRINRLLFWLRVKLAGITVLCGLKRDVQYHL